jgi:hypothetical protein
MIEDLTLGHGNTFNFHVKVLRLIPSDGHALQLAPRRRLASLAMAV